MMSFLFILFLSVLLLVMSIYLLRNTVFGVDLKKPNYLGFFLFYNICMYIIPAALLLNYFPIEKFWVAYAVQQDTVFWVTCLIYWSLFVCIVSLWLFSKLNRKYFDVFSQISVCNEKRRDVFCVCAISICLILMLVVWQQFNVDHSFVGAFFYDHGISKNRFLIQHHVVTRYVSHLFYFVSPLLAAIIGARSLGKSKLQIIGMLILILFVASWGGGKAPILKCILVFVVSNMVFNKKILNVSQMFKTGILIFALLFITYKVVILQYPNMTEISTFLDYFYQRVFVAQMIGVYEQFNLMLQDYSYCWHGVPFASFFIDFPQFHKDLMLFSENRFDALSIGIKNTFFIAEAFGMGGWPLLLVSPVIVAFNFSLTFMWVVFLLNRVVFYDLEFTKRIVAISLFSYISITGGFSDLMLFKITIMISILLIPFMISSYFVCIFTRKFNS